MTNTPIQINKNLNVDTNDIQYIQHNIFCFKINKFRINTFKSLKWPISFY